MDNLFLRPLFLPVFLTKKKKKKKKKKLTNYIDIIKKSDTIKETMKPKFSLNKLKSLDKGLICFVSCDADNNYQ